MAVLDSFRACAVRTDAPRLNGVAAGVRRSVPPWHLASIASGSSGSHSAPSQVSSSVFHRNRCFVYRRSCAVLLAPWRAARSRTPPRFCDAQLLLHNRYSWSVLLFWSRVLVATQTRGSFYSREQGAIKRHLFGSPYTSHLSELVVNWELRRLNSWGSLSFIL